jgi:hypothetical protein
VKSRSGEWSVLLFVVGLLVFNPPVLSIFSVPKLLFGVPVLYLYIFAAWAGVIALLAWNVSRLTGPEDEPDLRLPGPLVPPPQDDLVTSLRAGREAPDAAGKPDA